MRDERAERVLVRRVPEERRSVDSPAVFAIRATDLLHGGLLQLGYRRPQPPGTASSGSAQGGPAAAAETPAKTVPTAPRKPRKLETGGSSSSGPAPPEAAWQVMAGASSLWGPGGDSEALPWMLSPSLGFEWRPLPSWALELRVAAPALGTAGSSTQAVSIDQELVLLGAGWRGRLGSLLHVAVSAGPAMYRLGVRGEWRAPIPPDDRRPGGPPPAGPSAPAVPYYDVSNVYWYGCAYGGAGLELHLESRLAVRVLGDLVVPMKRAEIRLPNRQRLQSGVPILVGTAGVALEL
jgi:hypothetical protein